MATSGWLAVAAAWKPAAFPVPATPEKFAPSHALGGALIAVTRQGKQWATPEVVAVRIVARAMAVVRRGRTWPTTPVITHTDALSRTGDVGQLYVAKRLLTPSIANLTIRQ